jgi:hypothetical protein
MTKEPGTTLIEIIPHRWGWKAFEAPGAEPVFTKKTRQSITRRTAPASAQGKFAFWIRNLPKSRTSNVLFQSQVLPMDLNCVPSRSTKILFVVVIVESHIT